MSSHVWSLDDLGEGGGDDLPSLEQQAALEESLNRRQVNKLHGEVVSYGQVCSEPGRAHSSPR